MTTRPAYARNEGTSEWIQIGPGAVESPVYHQATEPTSAPTGSIWVNSGINIPSAYANNYRWQYTATGGETTLSGSGLVYTPGYEQVFLNGVLLVRGSDYVATTGTTISNLVALVTGDAVEVITVGTYPVADTYTQAQADSKFNTNAKAGMSLIVPSSVSVASGSASVATNGAITFTSSTSLTINGCFSSIYDNYKIIISGGASLDGNAVDIRLNNSTLNTYAWSGNWTAYSASMTTTANTGQTYFRVGLTGATSAQFQIIDLLSPYLSKPTMYVATGASYGYHSTYLAGVDTSTNSSTGITIFSTTTLQNCTVRIYGYNNGA